MLIYAPISAGELIDKITILEIKARRIRDASGRGNVLRELRALQDARLQLPAGERLDAYCAALSAVNEALWELEDAVRRHERQREFSGVFVELARTICRRNDERAALKRALNELVGSTLVEEKVYDDAVHGHEQ